MDFTQASQNGVVPSDELYTDTAPHRISANSTSTYNTQEIIFRTACTIPYPKDVPVVFTSEFTPINSSTSTTITLGEAYF